MVGFLEKEAAGKGAAETRRKSHREIEKPAAPFIIAFFPCLDYVNFMIVHKSAVIRILFSVTYFPFIVFLILTIYRTSVDIFRDIKSLWRST